MRLPESTGGDFTPPPDGTHKAICYRFIDMGTQCVKWQEQVKYQHKIMLSWELPEEKMDDGQPFTIHQRYTWSTHEKARLRHDLEAWRGKKFTEADFGPDGFDIRNVLKVPCLLTILHDHKNGNTYANIGGIMAPPKGTPIPELTNPAVYFSLDPSEFDQATFESLSDGLRETIAKSPEYIELKNGRPSEHALDAPPLPHDNGSDLDDEIPF